MSNFTAVKICVLGMSNVGKTCISLRYVDDTYQDGVPATSGASFLIKNCTASNGTLFKFQIWDTVGQERYKSLAPMYYRGASAIIIVYDITDRNSFLYGAKDWVTEAKSQVHEDPLIVLVGNKLDLASLERKVEEREASDYAENVGAVLFETSAKTGKNIDKVFQDIADRLETELGTVSRGRMTRTDTIKVRSQNSKSIEKKNKFQTCCSST